jgi:hypothetical protein
LIVSSGIRARVPLFNKILLNLEARFPSQETRKKKKKKKLEKIPVIHYRPFPEQEQGLPGFFSGSKAGYTFIHTAKRAAIHGRTHGHLGANGADLNSRKPAAYGPYYRSVSDDLRPGPT